MLLSLFRTACDALGSSLCLCEAFAFSLRRLTCGRPLRNVNNARLRYGIRRISNPLIFQYVNRAAFSVRAF